MERCLNLWMWNEWGTHLAFKGPDRAPVKWFAARVEERLSRFVNSVRSFICASLKQENQVCSFLRRSQIIVKLV